MKNMRELDDAGGFARRMTAILEGRKGRLGAVVYREREVFRRRMENSGFGGGKNGNDWAEGSYLRARAVGFPGDFVAWVRVLRA